MNDVFPCVQGNRFTHGPAGEQDHVVGSPAQLQVSAGINVHYENIIGHHF